jgi:proteasome assembly chaperone (PAC2) family protein
MEHLRWSSRPELLQPVVVAAFEGWNDAGDAASTAVAWLRDRWQARRFASIDPEEFFDFTSTRPQVELVDGVTRSIKWPANDFSAARIGPGRDVVLLAGTEPQLKWRTFCEQVTGLARSLDAGMVVTLGALLAEVAHSRPVSVVCTSSDRELMLRLGVSASTYEGPTGIVGVLHDACRRAGLPSASLWAAVPAYVPGAPSPKAALALVERTAQLLDVGVTTTDLQIASAAYERQVSEVVADDEDMAGYVARLEAREDEGDDVTPGSLVEEVERFLRNRPED